MPPFWEVGVVGVEVSVDSETGVVRVEQLATVADVGFALNPRAVEGQDLGAATQGLGGALYEELIYDGQQLANPNMVDYRVPRITDMPTWIHTVIAERRRRRGPLRREGRRRRRAQSGGGGHRRRGRACRGPLADPATAHSRAGVAAGQRPGRL